MTAEFDPKGFASEARSEQAATILKVEQQVVNAIWSRVPPHSRIAYEKIEAEFETGGDVDSYEFFQRANNLILQSAHGLNARVRQVLVEDAFAGLLSKLKGEDGDIVELFPRSTDAACEGMTILDAYKYNLIPLKLALRNPYEQAKNDIMQTVMDRDVIVPTNTLKPISTSVDLVSPGNGTLIVPTSMSGVMLRFNLLAQGEIHTAEFILHRAA